MELRSARRKDYKITLINLGLYEDGMKLEEMRQMMQALEESQLECDTIFFEADFERAMKKNLGSPEIASEKFIVEAVVHHDLNWNPPLLEGELELQSSYHKSYNSNHIKKRKSTESEGVYCDIKRSRPPITSSPKLINADSETSFAWQSEDQEQVSEEYYSDPSF